MTPDQFSANLANLISFSIAARQDQEPDSTHMFAFFERADVDDLRGAVRRLVGIASAMAIELGNMANADVSFAPKIDIKDRNGNASYGHMTLTIGERGLAI